MRSVCFSACTRKSVLYFRLMNPGRRRTRVESVAAGSPPSLRAMARKLGGDPAATDSTSIVRLPGFINRKYKTDFRVQAEKHTDRIHHLQDFRLHTEPIDNNFRAHYRLLTQRSSETQPLSQSEHDCI